uniref:hypothetical protein n=1 Tax=Pedobacter schmidteae TaxID=2201271 RepID=UPI000EB129F7|nr:hypothetical protein [Pedobacter schmidteae]
MAQEIGELMLICNSMGLCTPEEKVLIEDFFIRKMVTTQDISGLEAFLGDPVEVAKTLMT